MITNDMGKYFVLWYESQWLHLSNLLTNDLGCSPINCIDLTVAGNKTHVLPFEEMHLLPPRSRGGWVIMDRVSVPHTSEHAEWPGMEWSGPLPRPSRPVSVHSLVMGSEEGQLLP